MTSHRITFVVIISLLLVVSAASIIKIRVAAALTASSTAASTVTLPQSSQAVDISQALPGQGSIVPASPVDSSSNAVLPLLATTTAAASTTPGLGVLSEHNKLAMTGSCVVTQSSNAKQCDIYVTYTTAAGDKVLGIPVTIATMNGEGGFFDVNGPLLLKNVAGKVVQYSGILPNTKAADVATYIGPATATSTLFVVTTPDGLRAQSTFASSTVMR
jgi:hypothetical protein